MYLYGSTKLLASKAIKLVYPTELLTDLQTAIKAVEKCNTNSNNSSCVVIAESEAEQEAVESEYNLQDFYPEVDEYIETNSGRWRKRVFIFDDYGNGIVLYSRSPFGNEKHTE